MDHYVAIAPHYGDHERLLSVAPWQLLPTRIQRPWIWRDRPEGVADVTRSTRFGNPFTDGDRATLVARYRQWLTDPDAQPIRGKRRTLRPPNGRE